MKLSIVTTLYESASYISEFHRRTCDTVDTITTDYEIIFVDDGSPDDSSDIVAALARRDQRVRLVSLSRNFGHHQAVMAGLGQANGDRVFLIDVDLEEQPEWLIDFNREFDKTDADAVFGMQQTRKGNLFDVYSGRIFYILFNSLSETKIPENMCTVRLMSHEFVSCLLELRDKSLFLGGNFHWMGFKQIPLMVNKSNKNKSSYSLSKRFSLLVTAITSFTAYPLLLIFSVGVFVSLFSGIIGLGFVLNKLIHPDAVLLGWSSVMISVWFLGGITISSVGAIGLYVSKIYVETKDRPPYIIRQPRLNDGGQIK